MDNRAQEIITTQERLKTERMPNESRWQENAKYSLPQGAFIQVKPADGQKLDNTDIYDDTAVEASRRFAAGVHQNLTSDSVKWIKIETEDQETMEDEEVQDWLSLAEDKVFSHLNASNFGRVIHNGYRQVSVFNLYFFIQEQDPDKVFRFRAFPIHSVTFLRNSKGEIDTLFIELEFTARQAIQEFGEDAMDKDIAKALKKQDHSTKFKFIWRIRPRDVRDPAKGDYMNMPWESCYVNPRTKLIVRESGFETKPFYALELNESDYNPWGYSIADEKMPTIKSANWMMKLLLRSSAKATDPPTMSPMNAFGSRIDRNPGKHNFYNKRAADNRAPFEVMETPGKLSVSFESVSILQNSIKRGWFVDLFLSLEEYKSRTAFEVMQLIAEKMALIGPIVSQIITGVGQPLTIRTVQMLLDRGILPPAPRGLLMPDGSSKPLKINLVSPLAVAQRASEAKNLAEFLQIMNEMAGVMPTILHKLDGDQIVDLFAKYKGVSLSAIKTDEQVQQFRDELARQQQEAAAIEQAQGLAKVAQGVATAKKNMKDA